MARPEEGERDAGQRDARADVVPRVGAVPVDGPAPEVGQDDEEAAIDGVQATEVGRRLQRRYKAVPARVVGRSQVSLSVNICIERCHSVVQLEEGRQGGVTSTSLGDVNTVLQHTACDRQKFHVCLGFE